MSAEHPLYPNLPKAGVDEAARLIESFKAEMVKAATEVLSNVYCDVAVHIESDSWTNFRNEIVKGLTRNYAYSSELLKYDFRELRKTILIEHREAIIKDLNKDLLAEVEDLKAQLQRKNEDCARWHR